jgi:hypothetical protein
VNTDKQDQRGPSEMQGIQERAKKLRMTCHVLEKTKLENYWIHADLLSGVLGGESAKAIRNEISIRIGDFDGVDAKACVRQMCEQYGGAWSEVSFARLAISWLESRPQHEATTGLIAALRRVLALGSTVWATAIAAK